MVLSSSGTGNTLTQPGSTNASGVATGKIASTKAEDKVVTATVNGTVVISQQPTVTFLAAGPSAANSSVTANPTTGVVADGAATSTITVTVRDTAGNPISGAVVTLTSTGTGNTLAQPLPTNGTGATTGTIASTKAELKTVTAKVGAITITQTAKVTFVAGAPSATVSTITASPASLVANGTATSTITVTVKDPQGNPVAGASVVLAATGTGNTLVQPSFTNGSGVATGTLASTKAEAKTVSAQVDGTVTLVQTATVTFVAGPVSAAVSTVSANPAGGVTADGVMTSTITVTALDAQGNPIVGTAVSFVATGTGNILKQPAVTDAAGVTTGTIASTKAEAKTITATAGGVALTQKPVVTFISGTISASNSSVAANPVAGIVADGVSASTITITVKDTSNNAVPGANVVLSSTGTGNIFGTFPLTNASGVTSGPFSSTVAEAKTVSVTVAGVTLTQKPSVTFIHGAPSATTTTLVASPTSVLADGTSTATVVLTVMNTFGNAVPGQAASLLGTGLGNKFTPASGSSNASGLFTSLWTSTVAEPKKAAATVGSFTVFSNTVSFGYSAPLVVSASLSDSGGCLTVNYSVRQAQGQRVDVVVEYSATANGPFLRATQAGNSTNDGLYAVSSSPAAGGQAHTFGWNSTLDLPHMKVTDGRVRGLRATPPFVAGY